MGQFARVPDWYREGREPTNAEWKAYQAYRAELADLERGDPVIPAVEVGLTCGHCQAWFDSAHGTPVLCTPCWVRSTPEERDGFELAARAIVAVGSKGLRLVQRGRAD